MIAYQCRVCHREPSWTLYRRSDSITSWACSGHLATELTRLQQREEYTTVVVTMTAEARLSMLTLRRGLDV